jgi:hypothetical protein
VRRADSAQIGTPAGISIALQVSAYSGEPFPPILSRNLFSKHRCRAALGDEAVKSGPEVSFVGMALPLSRARKRLTGTGSGPDGAVIRPSGKPEAEAPASDPGEEMALVKAVEIVGIDIGDAPFVHDAGRDQPGPDQVAQPLGRVGIDLVVPGAHSLTLTAPHPVRMRIASS